MNPKDRADVLLKLLGMLLSWPVLVAAVLIVYRNFIRAQLPEVFKRLKSIGKDGLELYEPRTTPTSLGTTSVSNVVVPFEGDHIVYHSEAYKCEISYPRQAGWEIAFDIPELKAALKATGQILIFVVRSSTTVRTQDGREFQPNVNVLTDPLAGPMCGSPILAYMGMTLKSAARLEGWDFSLKAYDVDEKTDSATFNYTLSNGGGISNSHFARVTIARGLAYNVTLTTPADVELPSELKKTLNAILNSFHVLNADLKDG